MSDRPDPDPHFIGWLPMPRAFARFLVPVAAGLVAAAAVAAGVVAWGQRSPGTGTWDDDRATTFEGVAFADPYPMLRTPAADGGVATVLLVEEGKHGAAGRVGPLDGRPVRVAGTLLRRDGVRMLELSAGDAGIRPVDMPDEDRARLARLEPVRFDPVALRGEIVDSKCYLGAMKPGDRRTHRGCAALCLRGGIPPLFVVREPGRDAAYLLVAADGRPPGPEILDRVGEPIELDGRQEVWGDTAVFRVGTGQKSAVRSP